MTYELSSDDERIYVTAFGEVSAGWDEWLSFAKEVATAVGRPITHYGTTKSANDYSKARSYSERGVARAFQADAMIAAEFFSVPEPFKQLVFDWRLALVRTVESQYSPGSVDFGCDASILSVDGLIDLLPGLLAQLKARYGFGGCRTRLKGPLFYAHGTGTGRESREEDEEMCRWSDDLMHARRFERGFFRAAFPINLLSDLHLAQHVGGATLASAIEMGKVPGSLKRINDAITLWEIPDEGLMEAQRILVDNSLLV